MPIAYAAASSGICARCAQPFHKGDSITHGTGNGKSQVKYHAQCPNGHSQFKQEIPNELAAVPEPKDIDIWKIAADGIYPHLANRMPRIDEAKLVKEVEDMVAEQVKSLLVPQTLEINIDDHTKIKIEGIAPHKNFAELAYLASCRENIYIYGNPGWG